MSIRLIDIDCYKELGIPPDANELTIRRAWKQKTKESHPDVNRSPEAAERFLRYTHAMEILLDPADRIRHDRQFGYYQKPKSQETQAKTTFSEFQKSKAEYLVKSWSADYNRAMQMREEQRLKVVARNRRKVKLVAWSLFILLAAIVGWIIGRFA
ncbi:MAG TPA: DnaJ domain-containing protein [Bacteroidia bacterium]|nr:DnaJ domain-containing protein [Bacteroidia bacterium]